MAAKRTARRMSALSAQTPAAKPNRGAGAKKVTRTKTDYNAATDQDGRIRVVYYAGRDNYRWWDMTDMQLHGVTGVVESLERALNDGAHFEPMPPAPAARPAPGMKRAATAVAAAVAIVLSGCTADVSALRVAIDGVTLTAEQMTSVEARCEGLGGRDAVPGGAGMWFPIKSAQRTEVRMQDTRATARRRTASRRRARDGRCDAPALHRRSPCRREPSSGP